MEALPEKAVVRPWGWYVTTLERVGYKTKILSVSPKSRLSLQSHRHRREMWSVVRGEGICTLDDRELRIAADSFILIPCGARHRLENVSADEDLVVAEVQIGDILEEDDIIRYADDFGRAEAK